MPMFLSGLTTRYSSIGCPMESDRLGREFNVLVGPGTNSPSSIAVIDGLAYVGYSGNFTGGSVNVYRLSDGVQQTSSGFTLHAENWSPNGMSTTDEYVYVVDQHDDSYVYVYQRNPDQVAPGPPATPNLTAGIEQLTVSWFPPSSVGTHVITAYDIQYRQGASGPWALVSDVWETGDGDLEHTISSLMADVEYQAQVRAVSAAGDGAWSATGTGTPQAETVPDAPTGLMLTPGSGSFTAEWTAPADDGNDTIIAYDLRYRIGTGGWTTVEDVWETGDGALDATISNLDPGIEYEVQVRAVNTIGTGNGEWSDSATVTTDAIAPDAPTILSLTPWQTRR